MMLTKCNLIFVILEVLLLARMIVSTVAHDKRVYANGEEQNYLQRFGYLPPSNPDTANLMSEEHLKEAIKNLQRFAGIPATGTIDAATKELMSRRRCALPDKEDYRSAALQRVKRYVLHGYPWKHRNLTWSLRTMRPSGLETGKVRRELSKALDLWAKNSKLIFEEINSDNADILIYFHRGYHGDGYPFDGKGRILAHAFFPGSDRGGDAHFDEEEEWSLDNDPNVEGTSLYAVAAHEFGHSLGLAHSSVQGALMFPWYQGISEGYVLPDDDKYGIQQLYGAPDRLWDKNPDYPYYRPHHRPQLPSTTTTNTPTPTRWWLTSTERPWRTRPHHRPNHYPPEDPARHPYHPTKFDWPTPPTLPPRKPHRHHTTPAGNIPIDTSTQRNRPRPPYVPTSNTPDKCDMSYDAITLIRRELFIFKAKYVWRLNDDGLVRGFPAEINQLFKFPMEIEHVDAVYERVSDNRIVFFIGKFYYVFDGFRLEMGYPKSLANLGLPRNLAKIDAAMVWGYNKQTYFFSGNEYWKYDEALGQVELDYPRPIDSFAGVGPNIDAVFQWKNGTTYFFKGKNFWKFDDLRMRIAHKIPKSSAHYWMGCPRGIDTNEVDLDYSVKARMSSFATKITNFPWITAIVIVPSAFFSLRHLI